MGGFNSETAKFRHVVLPWIFDGAKVVDIGFGGDRIVPWAVAVDLPTPYSGASLPDVACDVREGVPLSDRSFDVVYSSALIEDFEDTVAIMDDWARLVRPGGRLIVAFPEQREYEEQCRDTGQVKNVHHKIADMGLDYMLGRLSELTRVVRILLAHRNVAGYMSLLIVEVT